MKTERDDENMLADLRERLAAARSEDSARAIARDAISGEGAAQLATLREERNRIDRAWERYLFNVNELGSHVDRLAASIEDMSDETRALRKSVRETSTRLRGTPLRLSFYRRSR